VEFLTEENGEFIYAKKIFVVFIVLGFYGVLFFDAHSIRDNVYSAFQKKAAAAFGLFYAVDLVALLPVYNGSKIKNQRT